MKDLVRHIVEDFDFSAINQGETTTDKIINTLSLYAISVDLGLPSGTRWLKYNIGCNYDLLNNHPEKSKAEDWYGEYYAWGETKKSKYDKLYIRQKYTGSHFNNLEPEDDIVNQTYKNACIPTSKDFSELWNSNNCNCTWINDYDPLKKEHHRNDKGINGLNGLLFKSKINNNELFLPAGGELLNRLGEESIWRAKEKGCYWTSWFYGGLDENRARNYEFTPYEYFNDSDARDESKRYNVRGVIYK